MSGTLAGLRAGDVLVRRHDPYGTATVVAVGETEADLRIGTATVTYSSAEDLNRLWRIAR